MIKDLEAFIAHARTKGFDHSTIRMLLLSSGWKESDIAQALSEQGLDMPIPVPQDSGGARDAFFHLLSFVGLYTLIISTIVLLFDYLNRLLPDAAVDSYYYNDDTSMIRWFLSAIIVAYPVYIWMMKLIYKDMERNPEKAASGIRRWLTYLTLFVAASTIMGDVIALIFFLLEGEISTRFIAKVLVILGLSGMVFVYYFHSLKLSPKDVKLKAHNKRYMIGLTAVVLITIVWGAFISGSPTTQRALRFDERRLEHLRSIDTEVRNIAYDGRSYDTTQKPTNSIPSTLEEVKENALYQAVETTDPETGESYVYKAISSTTYEICATFSQLRDERYDIQWNHPAGNYCFERDVTDTSW